MKTTEAVACYYTESYTDPLSEILINGPAADSETSVTSCVCLLMLHRVDQSDYYSLFAD